MVRFLCLPSRRTVAAGPDMLGAPRSPSAAVHANHNTAKRTRDEPENQDIQADEACNQDKISRRCDDAPLLLPGTFTIETLYGRACAQRSNHPCLANTYPPTTNDLAGRPLAGAWELRSMMGIRLQEPEDPKGLYVSEPSITLTEFMHTVLGALDTLLPSTNKAIMKVLKEHYVWEPVAVGLRDLHVLLKQELDPKQPNVPVVVGDLEVEKTFERLIDFVAIIQWNVEVEFTAASLSESWTAHLRRVVRAFISAHASAVFFFWWDEGKCKAFF